MSGTYPNYTGNTQDTSNDIPGRTDIANAADYNILDAEILAHQVKLKKYQQYIDDGGITGPSGVPGASGVSGEDGEQGPIGPTGPSGVSGASGVPGLQGPSGVPGATVYAGDHLSFSGYTLSVDDDFVLSSGDIMTGRLTLSGDPTINMHAATKQYVDNTSAGEDVKVKVTTNDASGNFLSSKLTSSGDITLTEVDDGGDETYRVEIDSTKSSNWDDAYSWGDHSTVGYIAAPSGSNTQIQFNDSGYFAGDSGLTYDKGTDILSVGGGIISSGDILPNASGSNNIGTEVTVWSEGVFDSLKVTSSPSSSNDAVPKGYLDTQLHSIDISEDTNLVVGTYLTLTDDTIDVDSTKGSNWDSAYSHSQATTGNPHSLTLTDLDSYAHSDLTGIGSSDHHTKYSLTDDLVSGEITQIQNINSVTISNTQWGYLGSMSGQPLESVGFSDLTGSPSDVITAGTFLSWDGDTLNASLAEEIAFNDLSDMPNGDITVGAITATSLDAGSGIITTTGTVDGGMLEATNTSDSTESVLIQYSHASDYGYIAAWDTGIGYKDMTVIGDNVLLRADTNDGSTKVKFVDSGDNEMAAVDSSGNYTSTDGNITLTNGTLTANSLTDGTATLTGGLLTSATINGDNNTISNLDIGNEVDWAAAGNVSDRTAFASGDKLLIYEDSVGLRKIDYDDLPSGGGGDFYKVVSTQTLTAGSTITATANEVWREIDSASNITLTSEPHIAAGTNGQAIQLHNTGNYNITLQDVNSLGGSLMRFTSDTVTIESSGTLGLVYNSNIGFWVQTFILNPQTFTPSISSFTDNLSSTREVAASSTNDTQPTFTIAYTGTPSACSIDINSGDPSSNWPQTVASPYTSDPGALFYRQDSVGGERIFTATATVAGQGGLTKQITLTYYNRRYCGPSNDGGQLTSAEILALDATGAGQSEISNSKTGTFYNIDTGAGEHIYYCYRSTLGAVSYFSIENEAAGFTDEGTISHTNDFGFVENFQEYRSNNTNFGNNKDFRALSSEANNRIYIGPHTDSQIDDSGILELDDTADGESKIDNEVADTYTDIEISGSEYMWLCHPDRVSDISTIKDGTTGFSIGGEYKNNVTHTNQYGYTETYRCWRSSQQGIYPDGENVEVT